MKRILYKLFLGKPEFNILLKYTAVKNQLLNLKKVWNNEKHNDIGIEKIVRLFLTAFQFLTLSIYLRNYFGKKGTAYRDLAIDFYILLRTIFPFIVLLTGLYKYCFFVGTAIYFSIDTILYIGTLIFVTDVVAKPRSYRRSVLLLFFNYIEIVLNFAILYGGLNLLNESATSFIDYIYFSFITAATIGYGDILPITSLGKFLVCIQSLLFLVFIIVFLGHFSSKVDNKDYFDS